MAAKAPNRERPADLDRKPTRTLTSAAPWITAEAAMVAGILLITALVYLRCLSNGFVSDDLGLILGNHYLHQWSFLWKSMVRDEYWFTDPGSGARSARYRPLLLVWFWLNYHLFGFSDAGWHASMVAVHLLTVWLVFKLGARLTGERSAGLLAALLFGLMPVHAEAVVWAAGFGLVLSAAFELGALSLIVQRAGAEWRNWLLAIGLYAAALLSHETAVAFPGLMLFYFLLLDAGGGTIGDEPSPARRVTRALLGMAPFAAEVALYLVARRLVLGFLTTDPAAPMNHFTFAQDLMTVPAVLGAYLALLVVPWLAAPAHRVMFVTSAASPDFYLPAAILVAIGAACLLAVRTSPRRRLYLFCAAWSLIALAPVMSVGALLQDQLVHDAYLYLASAGCCVMAADWMVCFAHRGTTARRLAWSGAAAAAVVCAVALWNVQPAWHDDIALFTRCVEIFPESVLAHSHLGNVLEARGDFVGAERELKQTVALNPGDHGTPYALGMVEAHLGHFKDAGDHIAESLKLMPNSPAYLYVPLVQLYDVTGDQAQLEKVLKQMEAMPHGVEAAGIGRARIAMRYGDNQQAEAILRDLTASHTDNFLLWSELGLALAGQNRSEDAVSAYYRALALEPTDLRAHSLAILELHKLGRNREALAQCRQALDLAPDDVSLLALREQIERDLPR